MPVDFHSIHQQVRDWGEKEPQRVQTLQQRRQKGQQILVQYASALDGLRQRAEQAAAQSPGLRCALPTQEPLNTHAPLPENTDAVTILAADGSQINPDRHAQVEFCVINVGAVEICEDPQQTPREIVNSTLLGHDQLYTENGLITEEIVALMRDLGERRFLAQLAGQTPGPVITLTDGPLELFHERETRETHEFKKLFDDYLAVLTELAQAGVATAGYVDKPRSDLLVRLLELTLLPDADLKRAGKDRPLLGVTDAALLGDLLPGERSAIFAIQSSSARSFQGELALHFFYVNVGREDHPWIGRVELPAWVAEDPVRTGRVHRAIVMQSRLMGTRPYPYALHRAHEVAVVSLAEKQQLEQMIVFELSRHGLFAEGKSNKQSAKDLEGRTRYQS